MSNMYEKVQTEPKKKKTNKTIFIIAAICVIAIIVLGFTVFVPMIKHKSYYKIVAGLSADTTNGSEQDSIMCTYEGRTFKISTETAYDMYMKLIYREDVDMSLTPFSPEEGIHIDYGTGGTLDIWEMPFKNRLGQDIVGVKILYKDPDGKKYSFSSKDLYYHTYTTLLKDY